MKKAIAMKCSQKDWDSIKGRIPKEMYKNVFDFDKFPYLANNFDEKGTISNTTRSNCFPYEYHKTFNAKIFLDACGIEVEQKFEITRDVVLKYQMKDEFPEAFKKELEVGKWYKCDGYLMVWNNGNETYGFWHKSFRDNWAFGNDKVELLEKATPQEVENALINEAKKRGFVLGCTWMKGCFTAFEGNAFWFDLEDNSLKLQGATVFNNGIWEIVDIIETITIQEAEKLLNKKIV